jgi:hypothetical protein
MECLSEKKVEGLYSGSEAEWKKFSTLASELLYGVIDPEPDTRNWQAIMKSDDILTSARTETRKMHEPIIDIESKLGEDGVVHDQYAVLKNKSGNVLRVLDGTLKYVNETLDNFGVTSQSFPENLAKKITFKDFNKEIKNLLLDRLSETANLSKFDLPQSRDRDI